MSSRFFQCYQSVGDGVSQHIVSGSNYLHQASDGALTFDGPQCPNRQDTHTIVGTTQQVNKRPFQLIEYIDGSIGQMDVARIEHADQIRKIINLWRTAQSFSGNQSHLVVVASEQRLHERPLSVTELLQPSEPELYLLAGLRAAAEHQLQFLK